MILDRRAQWRVNERSVGIYKLLDQRKMTMIARCIKRRGLTIAPVVLAIIVKLVGAKIHVGSQGPQSTST